METTCIRCGTTPCACTETETKQSDDIFEVTAPATTDLSANQFPECTPKDLYVRFLQSLYLIYSAMENEMTNPKKAPTFPMESVLFADQLFRRSALSRDLNYFLGREWKSKTSSTRATDDYISRIKEVGRTDPDLLLAHHSTRYIGDLQTCDKSRARTRRVFGIPSHPQIGDADSNPGVAFHVFEQIQDKEKFQEEYFRKIRELDLPVEVSRKIAKEAKIVYQLNLNLYWELQELVSKAGEEYQLALDSKYQSLLSIDGKNENKEMQTTAPPYLMKTDDETTDNGEVSEGKRDRVKIRCRGAPLFFYSLLFWLLVLFVVGVVVWKNRIWNIYNGFAFIN